MAKLMIVEGFLEAPKEWEFEDDKTKKIMRGFAGKLLEMGGFTKFACDAEQARILERADKMHVRIHGEPGIDRKGSVPTIKFKNILAVDVLDEASNKYQPLIKRAA